MDKDLERIKKENEFLDQYVFVGLKNLNDGFDYPEMKYFSERDFEIVLQRVRKLGLGVYGIETNKDGEYYGVQIHEQTFKEPMDPTWYEQSFQDFKNTGEELQYAATYFVPDELLGN